MAPYAGLDSPQTWIEAGQILLKVVIASLLGGAIGWQREVHGRPAGVRTHMMLVIGVVILSEVSRRFGGDPGRVAAQIVTGVGFLGAGTILRMGLEIKGLTTAASLWATTGIAMAVSMEGTMLVVAVASTVLALIVLAWVNKLEKALLPEHHRNTLLATFESKASLTKALGHLWDGGAKINAVHLSESVEGFQAELDVNGNDDKIMQDVSRAEGFVRAIWSDRA